VNKVPKLAVLKVTGSSPTGASNKSRAGRGGTRAPSPVTKPAEQDDKFLFMMYERWREVAGGDNGADMRASGCAGEDGLGIDADKSMKDGEGVGFGGSSVPRAGQSVKVVTAAASSPAGSNSMQLSSSAGKAAAATACGAACLSDQQAQNAHEVSDSAVQAAASQQGAAAAAVSSEIGLEEGEGSRRATRQSTASSHAEAGGRDTPKGGRETPTHTTSVERQQPTEEKKSAEAPGDVLFVSAYKRTHVAECFFSVSAPLCLPLSVRLLFVLVRVYVSVSITACACVCITVYLSLSLNVDRALRILILPLCSLLPLGPSPHCISFASPLCRRVHL
jgi:hypothetical protein